MHMITINIAILHRHKYDCHRCFSVLQFSTWVCSDNLDYADLFETWFPSASSVSLAWIKVRLLIDSYECVYACNIYYWVFVSWKKN